MPEYYTEDLSTLVLSKEAQEKLSEAVWRAVPGNSLKIAQALKPLSDRVLEALEGMPLGELDKIAVSQDGAQAVIKLNTCTPSPEWDKLAEILPKWDYSDTELLQRSFDRSDWVPLAYGIPLEKVADISPPAPTSPSSVPDGDYSHALTAAGEISGYLPGGKYGWGIPGVPNFPRHLQGMLAGGLLGGAAGYGLGWLGSKVLPNSWDKRKLKRNMAILGAGIGAAPGIGLMGINALQGKNVFDDGPFGVMPIQDEGSLFGQGSQNHTGKLAHDLYSNSRCFAHISYADAAAKYSAYELPEMIKEAFSLSGIDAPFETVAIPIDKLNENLFLDPRVYQSLPMPVRAATSGVMESAWALRNSGQPARGPRFVYPSDIARITAGMGSGYLSGAIVGKALGALLGMPEQTQDKLKSIGLWSGVVANVAPILFGQ